MIEAMLVSPTAYVKTWRGPLALTSVAIVNPGQNNLRTIVEESRGKL
jgi:hypothetical protein